MKSLLVVLALTFGMLGITSTYAASGVLRQTVLQAALLAGGPAGTFAVSLSPVDSDKVGVAERQLSRRTGAAASSATIETAAVGLWVRGLPRTEIPVAFVEPSLRAIRPFVLRRGEWLQKDERAAPALVLNVPAAGLLAGAGAVHLGTASTRLPAQVQGVIDDGLIDPRAYVRIERASYWAEDADRVVVVLSRSGLTPDVIRSAFSNLQGLGATYQIGETAQTDTVAELADELTATTTVLLALGALGLIATVVGVANVGLATARVRAEEFRLRQTLGASRRVIAAITLLESQIIALAAAFVAFLTSSALFPLVISAFGVRPGIAEPSFSFEFALLCLALASGTALLASIVPAALSYKRDLSSVMR